MRFIDSGESLNGACVRFEHGGKIYCAKGPTRRAILQQVQSVIDAGGNLDILYGNPSAPAAEKESEPEETKSLDEAVEVQTDSEVEPKPESKPAKGVKARG